MATILRIVICGKATSVFLRSIEAGLSNCQDVEVLCANPFLPDATERIMALGPDVVIMEPDSNHSKLALALLRQGIPLIRLDADDPAITLLTGQRVPAAGVEDLVQNIQKIITIDQLPE